ncbi:MAG: sugar transferase [Clostridia bacterium]|nr:sugar transferase [Clostridia bacterium]
MTSVEELKALKIEYPPEEAIVGCNSFYNRVVKRMIDFVLALFATILLSPLLLVISLLIVIDDGFPVFYRAYRGGYKNKSFKIFKFRSMVKNADKIGGGTTALNDDRITKIGHFIRKTKMDEFANLFNILRGEMSFIGPRPELLRYTEQYEGVEQYIFEVRPGITDFSSDLFINLDEIVGDQNADEMYETYVLKNKNALRVKYAAEVSFKTDIKIFFKTVFDVVKKAVNVIFGRK